MKPTFFKTLIRRTTILSFLLLNTSAYSQSAATDSVSVQALYEQSKKYWYTNTDSANYYLDQLEEQAISIDYQRGVAYSLYGRGIIEPVLHTQFQFYTRSLAIFEALGDKFGIGLNLIKIGFIYRQIGQPEKAVEIYRSALEVKKQVGESGGIALALIEIGQYHINKGEYGEALKYFEESLVYRLKTGNKQGIAYSQVNIGDANFLLNNMNEALTMADSAISNFSTTQDLDGQIRSLYLRGTIMQKLNKPDEAHGMFEKIVQYPSHMQFRYHAMKAKSELIKTSAARGDIEKAFRLQSEYLAARDTLSRHDYRAETQRLVNEFEFEKLERQRLHDKQLKEAGIAKRNTLEYLSISIVVIVIFAMLFSGRKKLSHSVASWVLLIGLLLLFEFVLVLTDSSVENITGGDPALKLIANLLLALIILPGHQFLEHYIDKRFLRQNEALVE